MLVIGRKRSIRDFFKTAQSVTPAMALLVQFGSMIIRIRTDDPEFYGLIRNAYARFVVTDTSAGTIGYEFIFYSNRQQIAKEKSEDHLFKYDFVNFFGTCFSYRYDKSGKRFEVIIPRTYVEWQVNNFFKLFLSSRCVFHDMILLHASAIICNGEAILFTGQSGAGKSTISGLSGYEVIHDDNIAVTFRENNEFLLRSIPFKEPYQKKEFTGRIRTIYRLFQDKNTYTREIPKSQQYMHLLFSLWSFDGFESMDTEHYNKQVIDVLHRIQTVTEVKELYFEKNKEFLKLI